jgi:phosphatidylethanolamine-binding protein (PEBP) family uncharacterized protein
MSLKFFEIFQKYELIPLLFDSCKNKPELHIIFSNKHEVKYGNELKPSDVKSEPNIKWDCEPDNFYTLVHVDPDAPSKENPRFREWRHWLVINIPGNDISKGEVLSKYMGASPPKGTGLHRYVFLLFKQTEKLNIPKMNDNERASFRIKQWAAQYNLGNPISCNFYIAQNK